MSKITEKPKMADGLVILGTVAIVGLVAVTTIALVYGRSFGLRGDKQSIEVQTKAEGATPVIEHAKKTQESLTR